MPKYMGGIPHIPFCLTSVICQGCLIMNYPNIPLYINGEFLDHTNRDVKEVFNPVNHECIGLMACASQADLDYALESSQQAFPADSPLPAPAPAAQTHQPIQNNRRTINAT